MYKIPRVLSASEMTYIVSGGTLNSTHSLVVFTDWLLPKHHKHAMSKPNWLCHVVQMEFGLNTMHQLCVLCSML